VSQPEVLVRLDRARGLLYAGRGGQAADELEAAIALVAEDDVEMAMVVEATLLGSAFLEPQLMARVAGRQAHSPPDRTSIRTPGERSWAAGRAVGGITLGRPREEIRANALAAAGDGTLGEALGADAPPLNMSLGALWWIDAHADVLAIADRTVALAQREGPERAVALAGTMRAAALQRLGDLEPAVAGARAALALMHDDRELELVSWLASALLAEALVDMGALDQAAEALDAQRGRRGASSLLADAFRHAEGVLALAQARHEDALEAFDDCGRRMARWGVRTTPLAAWRVGKARALAALDRRDEALEVADEEVQVSGEVASGRARGIAHGALGEITRGAAGVEHLRDAVAALDRAGARVEQARALLALGSLLRREDQRREARVALREAETMARAAGARRLAAQAAAELRASGGRARSDTELLTEGERRVAELAAGGASNHDIARALGVTIRTVETHLSHAYAKLGVSGRGELAAALSR
jgi:DNA-binding NarL/FixJ family response regulator